MSIIIYIYIYIYIYIIFKKVFNIFINFDQFLSYQYFVSKHPLTYQYNQITDISIKTDIFILDHN